MRKLKSIWKFLTVLLIAVLTVSFVAGCEAQAKTKNKKSKDNTVKAEAGKAEGTRPEKSASFDLSDIDEDEIYFQAEEVAAYIHLYEHLPDNYITKDEAKELGWVSSKGNLWDVAPNACIGGDSFGNREGLLPKKKGRKYYECDVNYEGGFRGSERLIYSNDGYVYYTEDHYETFDLIYEGE